MDGENAESVGLTGREEFAFGGVENGESAFSPSRYCRGRIPIISRFERIHRSNLLMMGILPLQYLDGENADSPFSTPPNANSSRPVSPTDSAFSPSMYSRARSPLLRRAHRQ